MFFIKIYSYLIMSSNNEYKITKLQLYKTYYFARETMLGECFTNDYCDKKKICHTGKVCSSRKISGLNVKSHCIRIKISI